MLPSLNLSIGFLYLPTEYVVSERGKMHVCHLRGVLENLLKVSRRREILEDHDLRKYFSEIQKLFRSILRDCCVELLRDNCPSDFFAEALEERGKLTERLMTNLKKAENEEISYERSHDIIPELIQAVKETFSGRLHRPMLNGMWGLDSAERNELTRNITDARKELESYKIQVEIFKILEMLCKKNRDTLRSFGKAPDKVNYFAEQANVKEVLQIVEPFFLGEEGIRLKERITTLSHSMLSMLRGAPESKDPFFVNDIHNIALSLLKFVEFSPECLLQFQVNPVRGCDLVSTEALHFKQGVFSQRFRFTQRDQNGGYIRSVVRTLLGGTRKEIGRRLNEAVHLVACPKLDRPVLYLTLTYSIGEEYIDFKGADFHEEILSSVETRSADGMDCFICFTDCLIWSYKQLFLNI